MEQLESKCGYLAEKKFKTNKNYYVKSETNKI